MQCVFIFSFSFLLYLVGGKGICDRPHISWCVFFISVGLSQTPYIKSTDKVRSYHGLWGIPNLQSYKVNVGLGRIKLVDQPVSLKLKTAPSVQQLYTQFKQTTMNKKPQNKLREILLKHFVEQRMCNTEKVEYTIQ